MFSNVILKTVTWNKELELGYSLLAPEKYYSSTLAFLTILPVIFLK